MRQNRKIELDPLDVDAAETMAIEAARENFLAFMVMTFGGKFGYLINWHHRLIAKKLQQFAMGQITNLLISVPPRVGKSEQFSIGLPAWTLGRFPDKRIIATAHTQDLAMLFSRKVQRKMTSGLYRRIFPNTRLRSMIGPKDFESVGSDWKQSAKEFDVVGHGDNYRCMGRGGGVSGYGGDLAFVDDPLKSRKDAMSKKVRDELWDWFNDDISNRIESGGKCVTTTRWHEDDLTGRILAEARANPEGQKWEVLFLPAIAEGELHPEDPRKDGETLWPWIWSGRKMDMPKDEQERKAKKHLEELRDKNPFGFASLFQQRPTPKGGGMFDVDKITVVPVPSAKIVKEIRYWDNAATKDGGARTAGTKMAMLENGKFCWLHVEKGQWEAFTRNTNQRNIAEMDGKHVEIGFEVEPGGSGKESFQRIAKFLAGFNVWGDGVRDPKALRADGLATQVNAGNTEMVAGDWNMSLRDEMRSFPYGTFKDQVDSSSGAFNRLAGKVEFGMNDMVSLRL